MATPSKKQPPEQQHAEEQPAPFTRLLACDDLLGKVYSSCKDSATKHALRVSCSACYRSRAINSFIDTFKIGPFMTPEDAAAALAAFPKLARMKRLMICDNDVAPIFMHLLGPEPEESAARAKLQCVDNIKFYDCLLNISSAAPMLILFPTLRLDHGRIQLTGICSVSCGFLGLLAAQSCITELHINTCNPCMLNELARFRSLRSLTLSRVETAPLLLEPLCAGIPSAGPQLQLTKLDLRNLRDVAGLDVCLKHHPLQELHLICVYFPSSLASMHLASPALRVMRIRLNLSFPAISVTNFPALHCIEIESIGLNQVPGMNAEESVQHCSRLASSIAEFPCVHCMEGGPADAFAVLGNGWPPAQFVGLLQALAPLGPWFQNVIYLDVTDCNFGCGAMKIIAALFPRLVRLEISTSAGVPEHTYSDKYGLSEAVKFPDLKELEVVCESPPQDTIRALSRARQGFVLRLVATNDEESLLRLDKVERQWGTMRMDFQRAVCLEVLSLAEVEEEVPEDEA